MLNKSNATLAQSRGKVRFRGIYEGPSISSSSQVPEHCVIRSLGGHKPSKHSRSGPGSLLNLYGKLEFISQKGIFMGKDWDLYFLKNWKSIQFYV